MKKVLKLGLLGLVIVVIVAGGYLGIVPGVSALFGSNKPRDLGIRYTAADLDRAHAKGSATVVDRRDGQSIQQQLQATTQNAVDATFTQQEGSAMLNEHHPASAAQLRIRPDGTFEISGRLVESRLDGYAQMIGMPARDITMVRKWLGRLTPFSSDPPFYIRGKGYVENGSVELEVDKLEILRVPIPDKYLRDNKAFIENYLKERSNSIPGHSVGTLTYTDGKMQFKGTVPKELPRF